MLKFLHSIFGNHQPGGYPESLVKEAIERAVDGTDPWIRAVSGYRKKLRPAVLKAIDHVIALVDGLPTPVPMLLRDYTNDRRIKSFFISADDMKKILAGDRALAEFEQGPEAVSPRVFALLLMEKQERTIFGAGMTGDVVVHDVPQTTVSFDGHRFIDPTGDEGETRRLLKRRAYDHLLSLALRRITAVKSERGELERRRALLQAKHNLLEREGWGFGEADSDRSSDVALVEDQLGQIETELQELGGDDRMLTVYLETVATILGSPQEFLWRENETIFVDRMGIKQTEAADDAPALELGLIHNAEGRSMVALLAALSGEELGALHR